MEEEKLKKEIIVLKQRVAELEHQEAKRKAMARISLIYKIVKVLVIIMLVLYAYNYVNTKIKPYKEKIDKIEEKVDIAQDVAKTTKDKISNIFK